MEQVAQRADRRHETGRYYQDAKDGFRLDCREGRLWHGLHRHLVLVMWDWHQGADRR